MAFIRELAARLSMVVAPEGFRAADAAFLGVRDAIQATAAAADAPVKGDGLAEAAENARKKFIALREDVKHVLTQVVRSVRGIVVEMASMTSSLERQSVATNVSVQGLQGWAHAAELMNASGEDVVSVLGTLAQKVHAMQTGNAGAVMSMSRLGVSIRGPNGQLRTQEELLEAVADRVSKLPDGMKKVALVQAALGDSGVKLIPLLNKGSAAIRAMREEVDAYGASFNKEDLQAASDYRDEQARLSLVFRGLKNAIGGPLLGIIAGVTREFNLWVKAQAKANNREVRDGISAFHKVAKGLLATMKGLYQGAIFVAKHWRVVAAVLAGIALAPLIQGLVAAGAAGVISGLATAKAWALAFLKFTAMAALVALAVLLIEDFITWLQGGDSLIGEIGENLQKLLLDWAKPRADDGWLTKQLKEIAQFWGSTGLRQGFKEFVEALRLIWDQFFRWLEQKWERVKGVGRFFAGLGERIRGLVDEVDPLTTVEPISRGNLGGRPVIGSRSPAPDPEATTRLAEYLRGLGLTPGGTSITINGVETDPEKVAEAVKRAAREAHEQRARDLRP